MGQIGKTNARRRVQCFTPAHDAALLRFLQRRGLQLNEPNCARSHGGVCTLLRYATVQLFLSRSPAAPAHVVLQRLGAKPFLHPSIAIVYGATRSRNNLPLPMSEFKCAVDNAG
ncbi:unnamed protein product [Durusdinium trenchii]|uniref:Uncharacterized protein n=1 Tax=Durusdinium trenchii TaxID=1381693 RepID=A0ABP0IZP2_9DINO